MGIFSFARSRRGGSRSVGSGITAIRSFAAAELSRSLAPWVWDGGFSNASISASLNLIRARSRDMAKNSEQYVRWLELFVSNVVGTGFTLKATPCRVIGKPEVDGDAARFIQYHWWKWSNDRSADLTGRKTFAAICRMVAENWARDGEGIVIIDRSAPNAYGFALRVVRPDALDEGMNGRQGTVGDSYIRNGVEVDRRTLRPVAYYFRGSREDPSASTIMGRTVVRVPAADVLHVYTQHDETQTRGIPLGHAVLRKLKMLDEFNLAELVAARDEANTTGIFHAPLGQDGELAALNDDQAASSYLCQRADGPTKYVLPAGWAYDTKTPQHPNREVSSFKNSMLRDVASGLGVEYACFSNDWAGVSFSSVRVGTLAERDHWRVLQSDFIEQFVTPVFQAWLKSFLSLPVGNPYVPSDYEKLAEHEFRGRRWEWVDPMKDINAAVVAVEHGWKTDEQVTSDFGGDIIDNLEAKKAIADLREKLGLGEPAYAGASGVAEDPVDIDDEAAKKPKSGKE